MKGRISRWIYARKIPGTSGPSGLGQPATGQRSVAGYIGAGAQQDATVVVDGRQERLPSQGFFLGATLMDQVTPR